MTHPTHDNCADAEMCYQSGYGQGWRDALDAYMSLHCWCGSEVGSRTPGDSSGVGCLANVTHNWRVHLGFGNDRGLLEVEEPA